MTKLPDTNDLKEERFILAHGFRGFIRGRLAPRQKHHDRRMWQKESCSVQGSQEVQREGERGQGEDNPFLGMSPETHFLQLILTSQQSIQLLMD